MITQKRNSLQLPRPTPPVGYMMHRLGRELRHLVPLVKFVYLGIIMMMLAGTMLELKGIYNIDLLPGFDTPIDNFQISLKNFIRTTLM